MSTTKFYTRRDSATTVLRKMGIHSRDYNAFIDVQDDGTFLLHITRAENHLMSLKKPTTAKPTAAKPKGDAKSPKALKAVRAPSISGTARRLISEGHTNQEVWAVLKQQFDLDDSKKHYPTWYRCEMKRTGLIKE